MSSRSIVDRALLSAAALCAAGLLWQMTVLVMTKNHGFASHRADNTARAATPVLNQVPNTPAPTTVRVVYPDGITAKAVGKATDILDVSAPVNPAPTSAPPVSSAVAVSPAVAPVSTAPAASAPAPSVVSAVAEATPTQDLDTASKAPATDAEPTAKVSSAGALNINSASVEDLNHLTGAGRIGQAIARHRPYRSVEDLLKKRVVRRGVYEQIKNQLAAE